MHTSKEFTDGKDKLSANPSSLKSLDAESVETRCNNCLRKRGEPDFLLVGDVSRFGENSTATVRLGGMPFGSANLKKK